MTVTTEGYTPPLEHKGVFLPVKLDITAKHNKAGLYPPLRRDGDLIYILPGGDEVTEKDLDGCAYSPLTPSSTTD